MTQITKTAFELAQRIRSEAILRKVAAVMNDDNGYCYMMGRLMHKTAAANASTAMGVPRPTLYPKGVYDDIYMNGTFNALNAAPRKQMQAQNPGIFKKLWNFLAFNPAPRAAATAANAAYAGMKKLPKPKVGAPLVNQSMRSGFNGRAPRAASK